MGDRLGISADFEGIARIIKDSKAVLILTHYNPDPDAYGSSCGLALALKAIGKNAIVVNESGILERYRFIPGVPALLKALPEDFAYDLCITCDCGEKKRVGDSLLPAMEKAANLINIDHHHRNDNFGDYNLVKEAASSTSEIVYGLLEVLRAPITEDVANALYAGLCSDSGSFRYASTSAITFEVALKLTQHGANPHKMALELYSRNSLSAVRLHAQALTGLKLHCGGRVGECVLTDEMFKECGAKYEDADDLVEKVRDIEGVLIAALIRFDQDIWRISLRSKTDALDVSLLARHFGGGGHKAAAAFRWRKSFAELRSELLKQLAIMFGESAPMV